MSIGLGVGLGIDVRGYAAAAGGGGGFTETWPGINGAAFPAGWSVISGTGTQKGDGTANFSGTTGQAVRDTTKVNHTVSFVVTWQGGAVINIFRSDSTRTTFNYIIFDNATSRIQYFEQTSGTPSNQVNGTTPIVTGNTYTIQVICSGTSITIKLNGSTEITATAALGLSNTYIGIQEATGSATEVWGTLTVL